MESEEVRSLVDEQTNRMVGRFERTSRSFRRFLGLLLGLSLAFFLLVLLPYVFLQYENNRTLERLEALRTELSDRETQIEAHQKVMAGIEELREEIEHSPAQLRGFIASLEEFTREPGFKSVPDTLPMQAPLQTSQRAPPPTEQVSARTSGLEQQSCEGLEREEWLTCRVRQRVLSQFDTYERILREEVVKPLRILEVPFSVEEVEQGLVELRHAFEQKLAQQPRFWESFQQKVGFSVELSEEVNRFWREYGEVIETQGAGLERELKVMQRTQQELETKQAELEKEEAAFSERLSQVQSPIGRLPVGLHESVMVFPILVAFVFLLCAGLFRESVRVRQAFHHLYQRKDPEKAVLTDAQVALVAPLWLEPLNPMRTQRTQLAILLSPLALFLISCLLVLYTWTLPNPLSTESTVLRVTFGALYGVGLVAFLFGIRVILGEVRRYTLKEEESRASIRGTRAPGPSRPSREGPHAESSATSLHPGRGRAPAR